MAMGVFRLNRSFSSCASDYRNLRDIHGVLGKEIIVYKNLLSAINEKKKKKEKILVFKW